MTFCRINLEETNYNQLSNWRYVKDPDIDALNLIYKKYCQYKKFTSVVPIFDSQYTDPAADIIGYSHNNTLVAFSLIKRYDSHNAESVQFAWDYEIPELKLGIQSLENECALYKSLGFRYLYLGLAHPYKSKISGYEVLGPLT
jgi:hypothetical protein